MSTADDRPSPAGARTPPDPRQSLKDALRELQELRRQVKEQYLPAEPDRVAIIGTAGLRLDAGDPAAGGLAFDGAPFGLSDEAAAQLLPYQRLLLENAWIALEQGGLAPNTLSGQQIGVFIGVGGSDIYPAAAAETVAAVLGLHGPVVNVDSGPASAPTAIHLASESLLAGHCRLALAGGVAFQPVTSDLADPEVQSAGLLALARHTTAVRQGYPIVALLEASAAGFGPIPEAWASERTAPPGDPVSLLGQSLSQLAAGDPAGTDLVFDPAGRHWAGLRLRGAVGQEPESQSEASPAEPALLLLSTGGHTVDEARSALDLLSQLLADALEQRPGLALADVAHTLRFGRSSLPMRRVAIVRSREEAVAALRRPGSESDTAHCQGDQRPVVFLFPGLGNHYLNMGLGLYQREAVFREAVDRCAGLLEPLLGQDIRQVIFAKNGSVAGGPGPVGGIDLRRMLGRDQSDGRSEPDPTSADGRLNETASAQPATFVVEYALSQLVAAWGITPAALLGYSIGEYVAAHLAGVMSLADALFLVARRAQLIQGLPGGRMLAVLLDQKTLEEKLVAAGLAETLAISAVNGPTLTVAGGEAAAIARLNRLLTKAGIASSLLPTGHPFHTEWLRPIAADYLAALSQVSLRPPERPVISNLTGDWLSSDQATDPNYWLEHTCGTVRFAAGLETLRRAGHDLFLEVGPGQALSGQVLSLGGETVGPELSARPPQALPAMRYDYMAESDWAVLQRAVAGLWLSGAAVDWGRFQGSAHGRRVALPSYPFQRRFYRAGQATSSAEAVPTQSPVIPEAANMAERSAAPEIMAEELSPAGVIAEQLYAIWVDILGRQPLDRRRTFFELGGNSLLATQLIFRIRKAFQVTLPLRAIFETPTLASLSQLIAGHGEGAGAPAGITAPQTAGRPAAEECRLPNGRIVFCQSKAETAHFYEDIFEHRTYLQFGLTLPPRAVVFDVGANVGLFTLFAHLNSPGATIHSFEPVPALFALLQANVERHQIRARLHNFALSDRPGTAEFTYYPRSSGMSSLYPDLAEEKAALAAVIRNQIRRGEKELVPLMEHADDYFTERFRAETIHCELRPLSQVIAETGVARIDLLKIDVQKSELDVLNGIGDDDWPKISQIAMEVHDTAGRVETVRHMLAGHGFVVHLAQEELYSDSNIYNLYARRPTQTNGHRE